MQIKRKISNVIHFLTGNKLKLQIARNILKQYDIIVKQKNIDIDEIQSFNGEEISIKAAKEASKMLRLPVIKSDVSYEIPALNNFPGPFVKFVNQYLTAEQILRLLEGSKNRRINIIEYLTYAIPTGDVYVFKHIDKCKITTKIFNHKKGSTFDKIIIRPGYNVTQNMMTKRELSEYFKKQTFTYHKLGLFLSKNK